MAFYLFHALLSFYLGPCLPTSLSQRPCQVIFWNFLLSLIYYFQSLIQRFSKNLPPFFLLQCASIGPIFHTLNYKRSIQVRSLLVVSVEINNGLALCHCGYRMTATALPWQPANSRACRADRAGNQTQHSSMSDAECPGRLNSQPVRIS